MADAQAPGRGIAWAGAVNLLGGVTGSVVSLVLAAVVGRHLGTTGAGTYFLVVAVFMIVSNVAELGADTGLVRFISSARATGRDEEIRWLIRTAVAPVLLVGLAVVAVAGVVVRSQPDLFPELSRTFIVAVATVAVLSSLTAVVLAVVRGFGDVVVYPLLQNVAVPLLRLGGIVAVLAAGFGVTSVLAAWMAPVPIILLAAAIVAVRLLRRAGMGREPLSAAQRLVVSREFWTFSAARGLTAGIEILLEWADVLIVGALASPTAAGIYAVATRCARGGEVVQQAARIAIGPTISAALARHEHETVRTIYGLVTAAMIWVAWPFYFVLAIFGSSVLAIFGTGFPDGAVALAILALAMGVATAAGAVQTILLMGGRGSWQLADKSSVLVLNLALDFVLVPMWGIRGAALAWAVAILIDTGLVVWQVQGLMGLRPRGQHIAHAAAVSVGVAGVPMLASRLVFGSSLPVLLWTLALVVPTYLVVGWVTRVRLGIEQLVDQRVATRPVVRGPGHG